MSMIHLTLSFLLGVSAALGMWFFWNERMERIWKKNLGIFEPARRSIFFRKKKNIDMELADFLDLLALGISSGLNLEKAWWLGSEQIRPGPLKVELEWVQQSLHLGRARDDAFRELDQRLGQDHLHLFFALLGQGVRAGSRLQYLFHDQATTLRQRRMMEWERRAQTASLRLLVPLFLFIFPTLFILLFAPLFIRFSQGASFF